MKLIVVGMNHRTAPVEVREQANLTEENIEEVLAEIQSQSLLDEAAVLSTCNRTEFYGVYADRAVAEARLRRLFSEKTLVDLNTHPGYAYTLSEKETARHVLRVAAGLDSMILGESQILGQVKTAHEQALQAGSCGLLLNRLLQAAISTGKRVRHETDIGAGAVSVASAASELASKIFRDLAGHRVLLIGVGEMGRSCARHMVERGATDVTIVNRTFKKAAALAEELNGRAEPFDRLSQSLEKADIVISCTGSAAPLVDRATMKPILAQRQGRPLYIIDIAVPRDFEGSVRELDGVLLHDIDSMGVLVDQNLNKRRNEIPLAETLVERELEEFLNWRRSLAATPTIKQLREKLETLRHQELERHHKRFTKADREQLDLLTESLVNKIFHPLMKNVRHWASDGKLGALRVDTIYEAFELQRPRAALQETDDTKTTSVESEDSSQE